LTVRRVAGLCASACLLAVGSLPAAPPVHPQAQPRDGQASEPPGAQTTHGSGPDLPSTMLPGRLALHKPNYVMPLTWRERSSDTADIELEYQISLKHPIGPWPLYFGYTQTSYFQWLDEDNSRPFRETNYNPELWYRFRPGRLRPDWLGLDLGVEHESNGEDVPESRGWNRVYARPWVDYGPWTVSLKLWYRLPQDPKTNPTDPEGDDNPRILDFYGRHELQLGYTMADGEWLELSTRYAFDAQRGAARLRYAAPTSGGSSYFYVDVFSGYGESLETFKRDRTRVGVGFALLR